MWPFTKKTETFEQQWQAEMLARWNDLEARVLALELADREYKKQVRRRIQPENLNRREGGGLIHGPTGLP